MISDEARRKYASQMKSRSDDVHHERVRMRFLNATWYVEREASPPTRRLYFTVIWQGALRRVKILLTRISDRIVVDQYQVKDFSDAPSADELSFTVMKMIANHTKLVVAESRDVETKRIEIKPHAEAADFGCYRSR